MARKTDGEKIDELEKLISTLVERVDNVRNVMLDRERFAIVEERLNQLKKDIDAAANRKWSLGSAILGGAVGTILAFLLQLALPYLKK
jgi:hypothetical protein